MTRRATYCVCLRPIVSAFSLFECRRCDLPIDVRNMTARANDAPQMMQRLMAAGMLVGGLLHQQNRDDDFKAAGVSEKGIVLAADRNSHDVMERAYEQDRRRVLELACVAFEVVVELLNLQLMRELPEGGGLPCE